MTGAAADLPIRQVAYFVRDIRASAERHHAQFGSGPFLVIDHVATPIVRYRGREASLDHGSAYGQWGPIMVEFVQQHDSGPSAFHDMYPEGSGREGFHHVALFVDDVAAAIAAHEEAGRALALYAETDGGVAFAMVDAVAEYGHMIELYEPSETLVDFYEMVRRLGETDGPVLRGL